AAPGTFARRDRADHRRRPRDGEIPPALRHGQTQGIAVMSARDPFTPDEQALADRLRDWSVAGPPAALDARILAQAHGAVAATPGHARRRPWLVGVATAAALVLTVGVAWRTMEAPREEVLFESPSMSASDHLPAPREKAAAPAAGANPVVPERAGPDDASGGVAENAVAPGSLRSLSVDTDAAPLSARPPAR